MLARVSAKSHRRTVLFRHRCGMCVLNELPLFWSYRHVCFTTCSGCCCRQAALQLLLILDPPSAGVCNPCILLVDPALMSPCAMRHQDENAVYSHHCFTTVSPCYSVGMSLILDNYCCVFSAPWWGAASSAANEFRRFRLIR